MPMNSKMHGLFVGALFLLAGHGALASDVEKAASEGLDLYKRGDLSGAAQQWQYAAGLAMVEKAEGMKEAFPEPPKGWSAEQAEVKSAAAMFNMGLAVSREYSKGEAKVAAEIVSDSPFLQTILAFLNNPILATSQGGKLLDIRGEKGIVQKSGTKISVYVILDKAILVKLEGYGVLEEDMMALANAFDFKLLRKGR